MWNDHEIATQYIAKKPWICGFLLTCHQLNILSTTLNQLHMKEREADGANPASIFKGKSHNTIDTIRIVASILRHYQTLLLV